MDEQSAIASAAEEIFESEDADEAVLMLRRQGNEQFPVVLFTLNVLKDLLGDPAVDMMQALNLTGVLAALGLGGYIFYNLCFSLPLWIWNFIYVWGKLNKMQSLGRMVARSGKGQKAMRNTAAGGIRFIRKRFKKQLVGRIAIFLIGSLVPFVNLLLLQSTLIFFAHHRNNKIVKGILAGFEALGEIAASNYNPAVAARLAADYAGRAASEVVRVANVSGRVGDRFGEGARVAAQRMEGNVTRAARRGAGRAVARTGESGGAARRSSPTQALYRESRPGNASQQSGNAPQSGLYSVPRVDGVTAPSGAAPAPRGDLGAQKFGQHSAGAPGSASGRRVA